MKRFRYIAVLSFITFLSLSFTVFASNHDIGGNDDGDIGGNDPSYSISIPNPLASGADSLYEFIDLIINTVILPLGGVIAVIYIIYAGFLFVTAQGNETKLETAKRAFLYAAIGTAVLLGAWAISAAIKATIDQLT